jgi:hypothetical protein
MIDQIDELTLLLLYLTTFTYDLGEERGVGKIILLNL